MEVIVKIIDAEFGKRVTMAVESLPGVPEKNHGRLEWIATKIETAGKWKPPHETIRRWMAGQARPHKKKMVILAQALQQDVAYLYGGFEGGMTPGESRKVGQMVSAHAELISSLIQLDGGSTSLPTGDDPKKSLVHMYAIIKGAMYSINVASLREVENGFVAIAPVGHTHCTVLCAIRKSGFSFEVFEISSEAIEKHGAPKASGLEVTLIPDGNGYSAKSKNKATPLIKITNFRSRI
jgi:hypothetical protein